MIVSNHDSIKMIKTLGTSLSWGSIPYQGVPLHVMSVYVEPIANQVNQDRTRKMIALILSVLIRDPLARIIIAGDFNHLLDHWKKEFKQIGLLQLLTDETPTRIKGDQTSQLD